MFENTKKWLDTNKYRIAWTVVATGGSYLVLRYLVPNLLSVNVVSLGGAIAVGYISYTRVALWEIDRAFKVVKNIGDKL